MTGASLGGGSRASPSDASSRRGAGGGAGSREKLQAQAQVTPAVVLLCGLCAFINSCDRVSIAVAVVAISEEKHWDKIAQGNILGAFFYGYVLTQLLAAHLSGVYGGFRTLGCATLAWSTFTCLTPWAIHTDYSLAVLVRILTGAAEAMAYPCMYDIMAYSEPLRRTRNIVAIGGGASLGIIFANIASIYLVAYRGWESVFLVFGLFGFVWAFFWWPYMVDKPPALKSGVSLGLVRKMLGKKPLLAVILSHSCNAWGAFTMASWLPTYFHEAFPGGAYGFEENQVQSIALTLPYTINVACMFGAGHLTDKLLRAGHDRLAMRKAMNTAGFALPCIFFLLFLFFPRHYTLLALGIGTLGITGAGTDANKLEVVDGRYSALLQGVANTLAAFFGVVAVPFAAHLYVLFGGSWVPVFLNIIAVYVMGAVVFLAWAQVHPVAMVRPQIAPRPL